MHIKEYGIVRKEDSMTAIIRTRPLISRISGSDKHLKYLSGQYPVLPQLKRQGRYNIFNFSSLKS
jgi:hypothetical protein